MTFQIAIVFGILLATIALFVSEKLRLDLVALMGLTALSVTGILTPEEALAGFAEPVVIIIAGLFVVGDGLFQTGVAQAMGKLPARLAGDSEVRLMAVIMLAVAILSGFMSSTGTVAVMLPVVMGIAATHRISPSRLLIPLSVASLLGGMLTLIGTAPNLVVSGQLQTMGREPFGFFAFTPIGLVILAAGIGFMLTVGRRLLPDRPSPACTQDMEGGVTSEELAETYDLVSNISQVRIPEGSRLVGSTLVEADLSNRFGVTVLDLRQEEDTLAMPLVAWRRTRRQRSLPALADAHFQAGHVLVLQGSPDAVARLVAGEELCLMPGPAREQSAAGENGFVGPEMGIAEVLLTPRSRLSNRTLKDLRFRDRFQLSVVGIKRLGRLQRTDLREVKLRFGDTLLVQGPWSKIRLLGRESRDLVLALPPEEARSRAATRRAPVAVATMLAMMLLMTTGLVPVVTAVILAAMAMVLTRCVSVEDAYRSINWESVVLIAAMIPMATALDKSGGMALIVEFLSAALEGSGPVVLLAALFVLTSAMSQVISNTATAVLVAPIAAELALRIEAAPEPFLMGMALAASTAFATPMASPVNTLVLGPGGYRFRDFLKVGLALQAVVLVLVVVLVPLFFPF